jgi:pectin methylesterase-like acyl-CoA thioesterase
MRKMFIINLIMALFMILLLSVNTGMPDAPVAVSGDFYVSPDGSDKNPGTEEKPWKTSQKAADSVASGSTVHIMAGTYYERVNINVSGASSQEPIVFRIIKTIRL